MAGPTTFAGFVAGTYIDLTAFNGPPATGTYVVANWGSDADGTMWYCTTAGVGKNAKWVSFGTATTATNSSGGGGGGGTVTQGPPNTAANGWPVKITDGTNTAIVSGTGALTTDGSGVTQPVSIATAITANKGATPALSNVAGSISSVTLQASNAARKELIIYNDSASVLYVKFGSAASATSFTEQLPTGGTLIEDVYTGIVTGIWASAVGTARVTEVS